MPRPWHAPLALAVVAVLVTACAPAEESEGEVAVVAHVVDGDTIRVDLDGEEVPVRLLNLDAPEKDGPYTEAECLGEEATAFLAALVPPGTEVRLVEDVEPTDRYGRLLAGVYLGEVLVNAEVARAGLAVPVLVEPNDRFHDAVVAAHDEARAASRGLYDPANGC
ncbi:micrococcal nuclease [Georgenia satyanarayanai]|uniref:Micrococcal nuclease n=1 Tax=Georgenia satyanarayanai TaxID=860221 RepID=A0A2Y8ZWM7_9MICO|nr:thermonuclease family protein [Georgenia satyanarayanai]PYG01928.1 micrococcal nuclease [Georgenia satyanarayanai]SSA36731.1 micrococcal nuclease [Georgenia satyanarayanai]